MVTLARNRYRPSRRYQAPVDPRSLDLHAVPPVLEDSLGLHGPAGTSPGEQGLFGPRDDIQKVAGVPADPFAPRQRRLTNTFADRWEKSTSKAILQSVLDAVTLPGDVYRGEVDMMRPTMFQSITQTYDGKPIIRESATSDEAIGRAFDLAGTLTLGTGAVPAGANELRMGIRAYHGSPHSFDKFSSERIGTGEGAQAYGHGLYFAENEGVARQYRDDLSNTLADDAGRVSYGDADYEIMDAGKSVGGVSQMKLDTLAANIVESIRMGDDPAEAVRVLVKTEQEKAAATAMLEAAKKFRKEGDGSMYEVDIAANPEDFLDWDKPLSEQSAAAKKAFEPLLAPLRDGPLDPGSNPLPAQILTAARNQGGSAEQTLKQAGIPGIRYLDQGSRGPPVTYDVGSPRADFGPYSPFTNRADAERHLDLLRREGFPDAEIKEHANPHSSNYVVFDDSLVSILKKYGVVGPVLAALGLSQALPDRAEANAD